MPNDMMYLVCLPCWDENHDAKAGIKFAKHYSMAWQMALPPAILNSFFEEHFACGWLTRHHFGLKSEADVMDRLAAKG
jgi:hypothetical protein